MTLPTSTQVTNMFLYGTMTTPTDLTNPALMRPAGTIGPQIIVNLSEYMTDGPGRFASPAFFDLVKEFFSPTTSGLAPGVYSKADLASVLGYSYYGLRQNQYNYADGKDDYAERVYVWNTVAFQISDEAKFIINADGSREIQNFAVEPEKGVTENFDFTGAGLAVLANSLLESWVDPSHIGRTIDLPFPENATLPTRTYRYADYQADALKVTTWDAAPQTGLYGKITQLVDGLWNNGTIKFLDENNRPIVYGSVGKDSLNPSLTNLISAYQRPYYTNGLRIIAGDGDDTVVASSFNDILEGGAGNDVMDGGLGTDTAEYSMMRATA
jgi:hypothetical protein